MCGIAGILGVGKDLDFQLCSKINDGLAHRGPDDSGIMKIDGWATVGHRRLSIIDLSSLGHQPMVDATGQFVIVFNGEIYNYQHLRKNIVDQGEVLKGNSDTEVLLLGLIKDPKNYLKKLEGMFAFCLCCLKDRKCILARDPAGIKPLYYAAKNNQLIFGSEARALSGIDGVGCKISTHGLRSFLTFGCLNRDDSIFEGIKQLPGGCRLEGSCGNSGNAEWNQDRFWNFPSAIVKDEDQAVRRLQELIPKAVEDHLIADVPVGIFLSSGIDSSILGGIAGELHPGIEAFTVCFEDHVEFDEGGRAAETAKQFQLKHHRILVPEHEALEGFQAWLAAIDQPSIDGLNTFLISRAVKRSGIKVALSGLGADELFGGYPSFQEIPWWSKKLKSSQWIPRWILRTLGSFMTVGKGVIAKEKTLAALESRGSVRELYQIRRGLFGKNRIEKMIGKGDSDEFSHLPPECADPIREVQRLEFQMYMNNMLLRDTDVCSMAHGLEVRVPFLDQRLIDFALSLDGALIAPRGKPGKYLLRKAMAKYLRNDILRQPKRGFVLPVEKWLKGPLRPFAQELLDGMICIPQKEVQELWKTFLAEKAGPLQSRIVALLALATVEKRGKQ